MSKITTRARKSVSQSSRKSSSSFNSESDTDTDSNSDSDTFHEEEESCEDRLCFDAIITKKITNIDGRFYIVVESEKELTNLLTSLYTTEKERCRSRLRCLKSKTKPEDDRQSIRAMDEVTNLKYLIPSDAGRHKIWKADKSQFIKSSSRAPASRGNTKDGRRIPLLPGDD